MRNSAHLKDKSEWDMSVRFAFLLIMCQGFDYQCLLSASQHCDRVFLSSCHFWKCDRNIGCRFCMMYRQILTLVIYIHCRKLMKSVSSCGSLSLLFMTKVILSCKVITALIVVLPSNGCCWIDSSAKISHRDVCVRVKKCRTCNAL
jgi:hypothetical protein